MVHAVINAAAIAVVTMFSGAWIYQVKNAFSPNPTNILGNISDMQEAYAPFSSLPSTAHLVEGPSVTGSIWSEYEYPIKKILVAESTIRSRRANDVHKIPPGASISEFKRGKWLIFFYADWCPHSRAYFKIWQELLQRIAAKPQSSHLPVLTSTPLGDNPELAAVFKLEKLPSFILLQDGAARGRVVASPTLDQLEEIVEVDWKHLPEPKSIKENPSEVLVYSMIVFNILGYYTFLTQDFMFNWISSHKMVVYSIVTILFVICYRLRNSRILKYL